MANHLETSTFVRATLCQSTILLPGSRQIPIGEADLSSHRLPAERQGAKHCFQCRSKPQPLVKGVIFIFSPPSGWQKTAPVATDSELELHGGESIQCAFQSFHRIKGSRDEGMMHVTSHAVSILWSLLTFQYRARCNSALQSPL